MAASNQDFQFFKKVQQAGGGSCRRLSLTQLLISQGQRQKSMSTMVCLKVLVSVGLKTLVTSYFKDRLAMFWTVILILIVMVALIGPKIQHYDPNLIRVDSRNIGPSAAHWLGTDRLGRDLFYPSMPWGSSVLIGRHFKYDLGDWIRTIYGMTMAFFGGWVDEVMMRIIEVFNSLPSLLITMLLMIVLGDGVWTMLFALAVTSWSSSARQARGLVMQLRGLDYVTAAVMLNTPLWREP